MTDNQGHDHSHGTVDPGLFRSVASSDAGITAVKWSLITLGITAVAQLAVVFISGSVSLLSDTVHNFADASSAIPLWIAFSLAKWKAGKKFTHGCGRVEDLAGLVVIVLIFASAVIAAYTSIERLINPRDVEFPWVLLAAGLFGFAGNEAVALLRITVGKKINSAALVADGYHARVDGFTSLAVVAAAIGALAGVSLLDPIIGLLISALILRLLVSAARPVLTHLLDGVTPETVDLVKHTAEHVPGVLDVHGVRARWSGHELHVELEISVSATMSVAEGHALAAMAEHELIESHPAIGRVIVHVDPETSPGPGYHHEVAHSHLHRARRLETGGQAALP